MYVLDPDIQLRGKHFYKVFNEICVLYFCYWHNRPPSREFLVIFNR